MSQQYQPKKHKSRREILNAIERVDCLSDLLSKSGDHFDYALDLEVIVYGRTYHGQPVGPYVQLLTYDPGQTIIEQEDWADNYFYIVIDGFVEVSVMHDSEGRRELPEVSAGELFGARSMLAGGRRQATVKSPPGQLVQVLKVQRPALRLLRKLPKFGDVFEEAYERHGRQKAVDDLILKMGMSSELRRELCSVSSFKAFPKNHVLFSEAAGNARLFIIIEGWVRRSKREAGKEISDSLGKGYCLGLEHTAGRANHYLYTAKALGRTEVLEINVIKLRQNKEFNAAVMTALHQLAPPAIQKGVESYQPAVRDKILESQERIISTGLVDANNLLVMDMDLCVRCGNCSMACHKVHGQSRLTRRGTHITRIEPSKPKSLQSLLAPAACMHCQDPECLTGCPTGAISRRAEGHIDIDPDICIGCGDCATQCPYDAIFMASRKESPGQESKDVKTMILRKLGIVREPRSQPAEDPKDMLAIKCNLCSDRATLNPPGSSRQVYSCEENCPTGALARIIPDEYFSEIGQIKNLKMLDQRHAYGRNIHKSDPARRLIHLICILGFILAAGLTVIGLQRYGYGQRVQEIINMRWLTGIGGLIGILVAASYQWRRQVYDKRRWSLRYWALVHYYAGVTACFVLLLHGGTSSGGWLTKGLMLAFDVAIITGLFGLVCYQIVPRLMTRIEGTPLLVEDLISRREELREELFKIMSSPGRLSSLIKEQVAPRFGSITVVLQQILRQEGLEALARSTRQEFQTVAETLTDEERPKFDEALNAASLLPRVTALIYLHRLLKVWLVPHIAATYLMIGLMLIHIFQVI